MAGPDAITLKRGFTRRSAFSLAFADVSPIAALYTAFSLVVALAGVGLWRAFPIILAGQLPVAGVAMVSQLLPVNGGEIRCRA